MWHLYIIKCSDESLYTGITTDVIRRISEHEGLANGKSKGAKFTRSKGPFELLYEAEFENKSEAAKEEYRIKKLTKEQKLEFIAISLLKQ